MSEPLHRTGHAALSGCSILCFGTNKITLDLEYGSKIVGSVRISRVSDLAKQRRRLIEVTPVEEDRAQTENGVIATGVSCPPVPTLCSLDIALVIQ
jgi:hypothetical protein